MRTSYIFRPLFVYGYRIRIGKQRVKREKRTVFKEKKIVLAIFAETITFKSNIFIRNDVREPN